MTDDAQAGLAAAAAARGEQRDRAVFQSAGAAVVSRLVTAGSTIVVFGVAAKSMSSVELGVVAVLTTLGIFLGLADFGLGFILLGRLPQAWAREDEPAARAVVHHTLATLTWLGSGLAVAGVTAAWLAPWPTLLGAQSLPEGQVRLAVGCALVAGALGIPASVGSRVLAAALRSSLVHLWNAVASLITLVVVVVLAVADAAPWTYVLTVAGLPTVVSAVLSAWVLTRAYAGLRPPGWTLPRPAALALLGAAWPYAVISLGAMIGYAVDSLIISSVLGAEEAAVFVLVARMFTLIGGTLAIAGQQMWSAMADAHGRGDIAWIRSRYVRSLATFGAVNVVACVVLVLLGRDLSRLWLGADLVPPVALLLLLAVWTVYSTVVLQASYLLFVLERARTLALASALMAPLNLGLSIVLTREVGIMGPVLGSLAALTLTTVIPVVVQTRSWFAAVTPAGQATGVGRRSSTRM